MARTLLDSASGGCFLTVADVHPIRGSGLGSRAKSILDSLEITDSKAAIVAGDPWVTQLMILMYA